MVFSSHVDNEGTQHMAFSVYPCFSLSFICLNSNGLVIIKMILKWATPVSWDFFVYPRKLGKSLERQVLYMLLPF